MAGLLFERFLDFRRVAFDFLAAEIESDYIAVVRHQDADTRILSVLGRPLEDGGRGFVNQRAGVFCAVALNRGFVGVFAHTGEQLRQTVALGKGYFAKRSPWLLDTWISPLGLTTQTSRLRA